MVCGMLTLHYTNAPPFPLAFLLFCGSSLGASLFRFFAASLSLTFFFFAPLFAALHTAKVTGLLGTTLARILRMQCKGDLASDIRGDRDWRLAGSPAARFLSASPMAILTAAAPTGDDGTLLRVPANAMRQIVGLYTSGKDRPYFSALRGAYPSCFSRQGGRFGTSSS